MITLCKLIADGWKEQSKEFIEVKKVLDNHNRVTEVLKRFDETECRIIESQSKIETACFLIGKGLNILIKGYQHLYSSSYRKYDKYSREYLKKSFTEH